MTVESVNGSTARARKGWRLVVYKGYRMNVKYRLEQVVQSPLATESAKEAAAKLLASIEDDKMSTNNFNTAHDLIKKNRRLFSKSGIRQLEAGSHAVFMACQSCENLRDLTVITNSANERLDIVAQIASAITVLSELQTQLIGDPNEG